MAHKTIKFEGLAELDKALAKRLSMDAVKRVVKQNGAELQAKSQRNAKEFKGHYEWKAGVGKVFVKPTGALRESIGIELEDGGMTAVVEPTAEYAAYVELGTRFMEAQPYLKPAWEEQKEQFKKDMNKLVK